MLYVYKPGQIVTIDNGRIAGVIIGIQIFPDESVQYRVEWFHDGSSRDTWLYPFQIKVVEEPVKHLSIGFNS